MFSDRTQQLILDSADDGSGRTVSAVHMTRSVAAAMRGIKRIRSDSDAGPPDPTPDPTRSLSDSDTPGLLSQHRVVQHVPFLATISNRSSDDVREALAQIEPHSESGRIFVALTEYLQHVGERQNVLQQKIDLHEQHSREWKSWQTEHDAKLRRSVEQTRVASNRVQELESEGQRLKRALQVLHDRATIRREQRKALKAQVEELQGELREVQDDLREANDTIVLCDRELRAVRAERATVVKLERSIGPRSQASTRTTRLR